MKKITLALSSLFILQLANAQVSKGSIFTGGSVNVNTSTNETSTPGSGKSTSSGWSVSPQTGVAIHENKIIGIQLFAGGSINKNELYH